MSELTDALRARPDQTDLPPVVPTPQDNWRDNPRSTPYLAPILKTEQRYNLPPDLLGKMANKESAFDPHAVSPAGAIGLMQIIPRQHPQARPQDPVKSIDYAGQYISSLNNRFHDWSKTLAAYNLGPRNVRNLEAKYGDKWLANAPKETQDYVYQLLGVQ